MIFHNSFRLYVTYKCFFTDNTEWLITSQQHACTTHKVQSVILHKLLWHININTYSLINFDLGTWFKNHLTCLKCFQKERGFLCIFNKFKSLQIRKLYIRISIQKYMEYWKQSTFIIVNGWKKSLCRFHLFNFIHKNMKLHKNTKST